MKRRIDRDVTTGYRHLVSDGNPVETLRFHVVDAEYPGMYGGCRILHVDFVSQAVAQRPSRLYRTAHEQTFRRWIGIPARKSARKPLEISRVCHDPATMQRVYDLGRNAADQAIAASNRGDWAWH